MTLDELLQKLWSDYAGINKQADAIYRLLTERGEKVENDHIAFRTYNIRKIGIDAIAQHFIKLGYQVKGEYEFKAKKLFAKHFEHSDDKYPKVFISELLTEQFSPELQKTVENLVDQVPENKINDSMFPVSGRLWNSISFADYEKLKQESEYAAWMAIFGFRANHFTVLFNALKTFKDFPEFNQFLQDSGFKMNESGGLIKGSAKEYLEQSSTLAHPVEIDFADTKKTVPACYYEFARRYPLPNGKLFQGFVAQSADKIFESTDNK
ncbi:MAG: DUF1338 domain-containing protein [Candidatus Omnitrophica bacterium]|nr:DUF1338 domain-containing protein [Candidatus Omnitrophota bacterium]MCB9747542.1 DUF1338 domain-containing protein [Candidatus Omnitrophota bacterium]